jgi:hypothetical protein
MRNQLSRLLTNGGSASRSAPFWHYDVFAWTRLSGNAGIKPDSRHSEAIESVIDRRHQSGRWPLNLPHPEYIPLEMETGVSRASGWNTLREL